MPFVRFSRDRRGYEHVYLIDSSKESGRSRVLYWFRTPPDVKVGRVAFDPETQRSIERQNPDVEFDWPQITAAKMPPPTPVESWREKRRAERAFKRARAAEAVELDRPLAAEVAPVDDEFDEPSDELEESLGIEARLLNESSQIVEVSAEPSLPVAPGEPLVEPAAELTSGSTQGTSRPATAEGVTPPPEGHRRRRRRRRRGGRLGNQPDEPAAVPNEPLDPTDDPGKPSNEG